MECFPGRFSFGSSLSRTSRRSGVSGFCGRSSESCPARLVFGVTTRERATFVLLGSHLYGEARRGARRDRGVELFVCAVLIYNAPPRPPLPPRRHIDGGPHCERAVTFFLCTNTPLPSLPVPPATSLAGSFVSRGAVGVFLY